MIDLHCHLLPGLDDGPPDLPAALEMARAAVLQGTTTIVATPHADGHYRVGSEMRDQALTELRDALDVADIALEVLPGAEIALDLYLELDEAELDALTLGGGPYLLIESPLAQAAGAFDGFLQGLLRSGRRIVLAHPERCPTFQRDPRRLAALVDAGALTSITAGAFAGRFGSTVRRFAFDCVRDGLAHSVASDAHDLHTRPATMSAELADAGLGQLTEWLTWDVPTAILAGEPVPPPPPVDLPVPRHGLLGRLRSR